QVDYTAADFKVRVPGRHVLCAITGKAYTLLKGWDRTSVSDHLLADNGAKRQCSDVTAPLFG
ncbi:MAG: hypothetical protein AAFO73_07345, partial [Pseudomonadota bacterium]